MGNFHSDILLQEALEAILSTLNFFDTAKEINPKIIAGLNNEYTKNPNWLIYCSACHGIVTSSDHKISVDGSHEHHFVNPQGLHFRIGCFKNVFGCRLLGEPTLSWTWFDGYAWSLANCTNCGLHIGWSYEKSGDLFYGLILRCLIEP